MPNLIVCCYYRVMSYLDRIKYCNNWKPDHYLPWIIEGDIYGWVRPAFAQLLQDDWSDLFTISDQQLLLNPLLNTYQERTDQLAPVIRELHQRGVIDTWVNENYPVNHQFAEQGMLEIERAATLYFGAASYGVHLNGLVKKADGIYVWVAIRARDKPFFPGMLDQMVAGGQPVGMGLLENMLKEAAEEAAFPVSIARDMTQVGQISYAQEVERGVDRSTIYIFDLWLPEDFEPENTDGEVDEFRLLPIEEVMALTENTTEFKDNCNLVNIDLFLRLKLLTETHADYPLILQQMYHQQR